jgi:hypothetical protein
MGRGFHERRAGKAVVPPYTQLPSTTPLPKRQKGRPKEKDKAIEKVDYQDTVMEVQRLYYKKELPPLHLSCYLVGPVQPSWWGILLGEEEGGYLLDSVSKIA